jgi:hypothetical protein
MRNVTGASDTALQRSHELGAAVLRNPLEVTLEMGGAGVEFLPPLEAPQGAGHPLTAAAVALQDHMNWAPL